jgi:hypothetical protein
MRRFVFLLLLGLPSYAQIIRTIEPPTPGRGDAVTMTFAGDGEDVPATVRLYPPLVARDGTRKLAAEVSLLRASDEKPQFRFFIPDYLPFGIYDIALPLASDDATTVTDLFVGRVRVTLQHAPTITNVMPNVLYPEDQATITVLGDFSAQPTEHALLLNGRLYPACDGTLVPGKTCVQVEPALAGRALLFTKIPRASYGKQEVQLAVDKQQVLASQLVLFSRAQQTTPRMIAFGAAALVLAIVFLPLFLQRIPNSTWLGRAAAAGKGLFVDAQTNTYSLSKIQLYLWLLAAVFGWAYLTSCLSLVQGRVEFAALPKNMPGILLMSVGTTTFATGLSRSRPKGGGAATPRLSDLVTSGDVVIPERVQYLVWTILGFIAFFGLILTSDPGTIKELPQVPEEFLVVMGLSSAGYLGGKLARQPGPILTGASVTSGSITLHLCGANLAPNATLLINGTPVQPSWVERMQGETLVPEDDNRYAKQLRFRIADGSMQIAEGSPTVLSLPDRQKLAGPFTVRLVNPDGQAAEYQLHVSAASDQEPPAERPRTFLLDAEWILEQEHSIEEWIRNLKRSGLQVGDLATVEEVVRPTLSNETDRQRFIAHMNRARMLWDVVQ